MHHLLTCVASPHSLKMSLSLETIYLLIASSYKYHSFAKERDNPEWSILFSALLFSYHCVQFVLEMIIVSLIAYSYQSGCKYNCTVVYFPYLKSKFQIQKRNVNSFLPITYILSCYGFNTSSLLPLAYLQKSQKTNVKCLVTGLKKKKLYINKIPSDQLDTLHFHYLDGSFCNTIITIIGLPQVCC